MVVVIKNQQYYFSTNAQVALKVGATWSKRDKQYFIPYTLEALTELYGSTKDVAVLREIEILKQRRSTVELYRSIQSDIDLRLRPYQREDLSFINILPNPAIFNSPRTGKTPLSLISCKSRGFKKVLICVPASMVLVWGEECQKWLSIEPIIIKGTKTQRDKLYTLLKTKEEWYAIVSYDTAKVDLQKLLVEMDCFILDEGHFLRNKKSQRSIAIRQLGRKAEHRYCLTGTPAVRHASDVWYILNFLYPEIFSSYWRFVERYFEMGFDEWTGTQIPQELKNNRQEEFLNLIRYFSVNRKLQDVINWLPDIIRYPIVSLEFDKTQKKHYDDMKEIFIAETNEVTIDSPSVLSQLMRLRQIALDPSILGLTGHSPKTEWVLDYLKDNNEEYVIIFSHFTTYLNQLKGIIEQKLHIPVALLTGQVSKENRLSAIKDFQNGDKHVILVNVQAGAVGITLDRAETIIFTDYVWSPDLKEQAEARFLPTTKEKAFVRGIYYLFMKNSVDYHMLNITEQKAISADYVNNIKHALSVLK